MHIFNSNLGHDNSEIVFFLLENIGLAQQYPFLATSGSIRAQDLTMLNIMMFHENILVLVV